MIKFWNHNLKMTLLSLQHSVFHENNFQCHRSNLQIQKESCSIGDHGHKLTFLGEEVGAGSSIHILTPKNTGINTIRFLWFAKWFCWTNKPLHVNPFRGFKQQRHDFSWVSRSFCCHFTCVYTKRFFTHYNKHHTSQKHISHFQLLRWYGSPWQKGYAPNQQGTMLIVFLIKYPFHTGERVVHKPVTIFGCCNQSQKIQSSA